MKVPPLPVVRPAPVAAAAGGSPTASAPPPAVYGYTPEQRVGTERDENQKSSAPADKRGRGGGADRGREIYRNDESQRTCTTGLRYKEEMTKSVSSEGEETFFQENLSVVRKSIETNKKRQMTFMRKSQA